MPGMRRRSGGRMRHRVLGALVLTWGLVAGCYLGWCLHRFSIPIFLEDRMWPQPWPYPDAWLARWHDQLDAQHPAPPGAFKPEGELYRLRGWLWAYALWADALVVAGLALLLWPSGGQPAWWPSALLGTALGLAFGGVWAVSLGAW